MRSRGSTGGSGQVARRYSKRLALAAVVAGGVFAGFSSLGSSQAKPHSMPGGRTAGGLSALSVPLQARIAAAKHSRRVNTANLDSPVATRAKEIGGVPCTDGSGAICGTLQVPLDWRLGHRRDQTIGVVWKLYVHTAPGRSISTITYNDGGPGEPTLLPGCGDCGVHYLFGPLFDTHDVLLFDDRGRGQSGVLDCPALQHGTDTVANATAACAAQLGQSIAFYSTASVARDTDALRRALGIDKFDYVGTSYGTMDALAYASRFPTHVRSIVVGSGFGPALFDAGTQASGQVAAIRRDITLICASQPQCHAAIPDPVAALAWAARYLRSHPIEGDAFDQNGVLRHVHLTEARLAYVAEVEDSNNALNQGELPAALVALRHGDPVPLLRIAATTPFLDIPASDAADFSMGAFMAAECADDRTPPWRPGSTYDERIAQALDVLRRLPGESLAPFSADSLMREPDLGLDNQTALCAHWPDTPGVEGAVVDTRTLPDVPVLGFIGQLDENVPIEGTLIDLNRFPHHQLVDIGLVPHPAHFYKCGPARIQQFLDTLGPVQHDCGSDPDPYWHAQSVFPATSDVAPQATVNPDGTDASTAADRRIGGVVVETVLDPLWQTNRACCTSSATGLRGGTTSMDFTPAGDGFLFNYTGAKFTSDVAVTGTMTFPFATNAWTANVTLIGPHGVTGTLTLAYPGSGTGDAHVDGTINGHHVAFLY